ncbi:B12-binding domain-containing radical SAM protein [Magnetospirillum sp. ME-1]|uniref:B12-binding domain-containing radical SAM protein n=1 Tax=Magnetospirillum sp. ME-1 TaxID=1639348 RepID=UPI000A17D14B|nr:cobalamin-dependent protein [Magnetospirillum sp. ME-1]ARJ66537.1 B12-binding domain-containing radical SAM protein [Magnetospirillum sp. ME-1]
MAKVLFINPVVREEDVPRHVPYGIALLAAIAMDKGHLVQVYDANAWRLGEDTLREVLAADDWQVVALGGMTTTYGSIKSIVSVAREVCPAAVIVLGGGILTSLPKDMMGFLPEVDVGVIGEAFETFPDILSMVDEGRRDWSSIPGTISRTADGKLAMAPQRGLIHDLDSLPYPAWDLFPLEEVYFKNSEMVFSAEGMMAKRRLDINASYGCSLVCRYCYHLGIAGDMRYETAADGSVEVAFDKPGTYTRTIRYHSPEYIVKMARHMRDKYDLDYILFLDENLMTMDQYSGRTWLKEICRLWHENGLAPEYQRDVEGNVVSWTGVHWSGTSHATLCTPEILKIMRQAGCAHLVYGYESFAPHVLKTVGKGSTPKTNIRSFFWTLEAGIRPVPNQIIGFPAEDFESIRANMRAWDDLGMLVKPHFATPYPGSEWFTVYRASIERQYGGDLEAFILDLGDASKISAVISHNFNAVELIGLRELMLARDTRKLDEYEALWRRVHNIPDGSPSTLYIEDKAAE